jgi:hypothetical protein
MHIALTTAQLTALIEDSYEGSSKPLSKIVDKDRPSDPDWWQSSRKVESFNTKRHASAARFYLKLMSYSVNDAESHAFAATFITRDGDGFRPDKGFVKMCLTCVPPLLVARSTENELVFKLTADGLEKFGALSPT